MAKLTKASLNQRVRDMLAQSRQNRIQQPTVQNGVAGQEGIQMPKILQFLASESRRTRPGAIMPSVNQQGAVGDSTEKAPEPVKKQYPFVGEV